MEFDLCDLGDLDTYQPEIDWHPKRPMAKPYPKIKLKAVRQFEI